MSLGAEQEDGFDPGDSAEANLALLGVKLEDVQRELHYRFLKRAEKALKIQRRAARENGERRILRSPDGGGEFHFQVHPVFYHYWGQRLGYSCWDHGSDFVREFIRDNPEVRIRSVSEKLTLGVNGFRGNPAAPAPASRRAFGRRGRWAA